MNGEQRFYLAVGLAVMIGVSIIISLPLSAVVWLILSQFMSVSVPYILIGSALVTIIAFFFYVFVAGLRA